MPVDVRPVCRVKKEIWFMTLYYIFEETRIVDATPFKLYALVQAVQKKLGLPFM